MADIKSTTLPLPASKQAYMNVSALEAGIIHLPLDRFVAGAASSEISICPSLAFFLRHSNSEQHFVFDLGLRRDTDTYPPAIQSLIKNVMHVEVPQTVAESCIKGGITPGHVETVILSHVHFDHIGDATPFTTAAFVAGEGSRGLMSSGYPSDDKSKILESSIPLERTRFLISSDFNTSIGPFPRALDFYGDGSVYIIDTPGHCAGHINILARTSDDGSWIYLGGDTAHDVRLLTGEKEIATIDQHGAYRCAHADKAQAVEDIRRVAALLKIPRVQVIVAHDWRWYDANKDKEPGSPFLPGKIAPMS